MFVGFICLFREMRSVVVLHLAGRGSGILSILFFTAFATGLALSGNAGFGARFVSLINLNFLLATFLVDYHGLLKSSYRIFINLFEKNYFLKSFNHHLILLQS